MVMGNVVWLSGSTKIPLNVSAHKSKVRPVNLELLFLSQIQLYSSTWRMKKNWNLPRLMLVKTTEEQRSWEFMQEGYFNIEPWTISWVRIWVRKPGGRVSKIACEIVVWSIAYRSQRKRQITSNGIIERVS